MYCPNPPMGLSLVYAQHRKGTSKKIQDPRCPRVAFCEDLKRELIIAKEARDILVVMLDGNMDMKGSQLG